MQNDFCDESGYYGRKGLPIPPVRRAIPELATLLDAARTADIAVIYTRLVHDPALSDVMQRHRILPAGWVADAPRLAPGSWGADIIEELRPQPGDAVIDKPDYSAFHQTGLE